MNGWTLTGTESQQRIIREADAHIFFPSERLALPGSPELGWRDLNPGMAMAVDLRGARPAELEESRAHEGHHGEDKAHPLEVILKDGRRFTLGLIYTVSGRIFLDVRLERNPELAMQVFGMEFFHAVDIFMPMTDAQRNELMQLWGKGGSWWEVSSYSDEYFRLGGEAWMYEGLGAYSDFDLGPNPFMHDAGVEPEDVWRILGIMRTDYVPPAPPPPPPVPEPEPATGFVHFPGGPDIYHKPTHRFGRRGAQRSGEPLYSLEGFRPCKVCKP